MKGVYLLLQECLLKSVLENVRIPTLTFNYRAIEVKVPGAGIDRHRVSAPGEVMLN